MHQVNPLIQVPQALEELVYRCLAKLPEERFQSMDEFIAAVKHAVGMSTALTTGLTGEHLNSLSAPRALPSGDQYAPAPSLTMSAPQTVTVSPPQQPPPLPSPVPAAPVEAPPRSRLPVVLIGIISLVLVAFAVRAVLSRPDAPPTVGASSVSVMLESDPSGAEVIEHGTVIGRTPLRETWTGSRGAPTDSHTFTFRAPGHADAVVTLSGTTLLHFARLQRTEVPVVQPIAVDAAVAPPPPDEPVNIRRPVNRPPVRPVVRARDAGAHPTGYRQDPYGE
jgi:hypothetical protein